VIAQKMSQLRDGSFRGRFGRPIIFRAGFCFGLGLGALYVAPTPAAGCCGGGLDSAIVQRNYGGVDYEDHELESVDHRVVRAV
jgi:hypothetical protein